MRKLTIFLLIISVFLLGAKKVDRESTNFSIANVPRVVHVGDEFTVYLILNLIEYSSWGHEVSVQFTSDFIQVEEVIELKYPHQFNLTSGVKLIDNVNGLVLQFEAISLTTVITPQTIIVGRITFIAVMKGNASITPFFNVPYGGVLQGNGELIPDIKFFPGKVKVR